jgi:hypothetical protein
MVISLTSIAKMVRNGREWEEEEENGKREDSGRTLVNEIHPLAFFPIYFCPSLSFPNIQSLSSTFATLMF